MPADIAPTGSADEVWDLITWNADGLVPVVTQQHDTGEVLMLAWADRAALRTTIDRGLATYYSRSRGRLWTKGEESGHTQQLVGLRTDCDGDCLLYLVASAGPACHQGRRSCFSHRIDDDGSVHTDRPVIG